MNNWITDRVPDTGRWVLVSLDSPVGPGNGWVFKAYWNGSEWNWEMRWPWNGRRVLAWQELPERYQ